MLRRSYAKIYLSLSHWKKRTKTIVTFSEAFGSLYPPGIISHEPPTPLPETVHSLYEADTGIEGQSC